MEAPQYSGSRRYRGRGLEESTSAGSFTSSPARPDHHNTDDGLGQTRSHRPLTGISQGTVKSDAEIRAMTISIPFFGSPRSLGRH